MPLELPNLDDRTFDDLLAEARTRIASYCPEWTDFNDSDPGMALVQLFAWLTDLMIYRLNQVPERNVLSFLRLLNLQRRPAQPATVQVAFEWDGTGDPRPQAIPVRTKFFVSTETGELTFESKAAIELSPYPLDAVYTFDGATFQNATATNTSEQGHFFPFGAVPRQGNCLYLGFRGPQSPPRLPTVAFPRQLVLYCFAPPPVREATTSQALAAAGRRPPVLVWEYQSVSDRSAAEHRPPDRWRPLAVMSDDTLSLSREGRLVIRGPGEDCDSNSRPSADDTPRYWIRCRLAEGNYDRPSVPRIAMIRSNVVELENRATFADEFLGEGDGRRNEFRLQNTPVEAASVEIVLTGPEPVEPDTCTQKGDLGDAKSTDLFYTLDAASGVVRFGDGKRGRIPPPQHLVFARSYRAGGGAAGNILANKIQDVPRTLSFAGQLSVTNPRPAIGGEDEEPFEDLRDRAPRILRGDQRAITEDDYRRHAEETPGVGRAVVVPLALPRHPGLQVPGALTVVVIPRAESEASAGEPIRYLPSQALLDLVHRRLEERRPTGVELAVTAPRYRDISIRLVLTCPKETVAGLVVAGVRRAIDDYFCPLRRPAPKPTRQGVPAPPRWEVGEPLHFSRLYEVVLSARDAASATPLVQGVSFFGVEVEGANWPFGKPLALDRDELPGCWVAVSIEPEPLGYAAR